ncbi:MAG TPA: hypothetical protein V6C97_26330 [Oculatellaceae cyanobacterium]
MGYSLHIERWADSGRVDIAIEEWKAAVESLGGIRLQTAAATTSNPKTPNQKISVPLKEGSVEVYVQSEDFWAPAITWREGYATLRAPEVMDRTDAVWVAAADLAASLRAKIRGDEGEFYDLETGEALD